MSHPRAPQVAALGIPPFHNTFQYRCYQSTCMQFYFFPTNLVGFPSAVARIRVCLREWCVLGVARSGKPFRKGSVSPEAGCLTHTRSARCSGWCTTAASPQVEVVHHHTNAGRRQSLGAQLTYPRGERGSAAQCVAAWLRGGGWTRTGPRLRQTGGAPLNLSSYDVFLMASERGALHHPGSLSPSLSLSEEFPRPGRACVLEPASLPCSRRRVQLESIPLRRAPGRSPSAVRAAQAAQPRLATQPLISRGMSHRFAHPHAGPGQLPSPPMPPL